MHSIRLRNSQFLALLFALITFMGCNSGTNGTNPGLNLPALDGDSNEIVPGEDYAADPVSLSAAWANDGGDKVAQSELRGTNQPSSVANSLWNGSKIHLFGAKNEVLGFNLVLEAGHRAASNVSVQFDHLDGPSGNIIASTPVSGDGVFDYTQRDIELFYVRYLTIKGLSRLGYEHYDERHIPKRLRRPYTGEGIGSGGWTDRPDHDQAYPDIAVPMEAVRTFNVAQGQNQSVWVDLYIPKGIQSGTYQGAVTVSEGSHLSYRIPVELRVNRFSLPDTPSSKTMLHLGYSDISKRYVGSTYPNNSADLAKVQLIRDRHFQMAHRHKISLIDANEGSSVGTDQPSQEWRPRLDGSLFTANHGYRGPGEGVGNNIFSIGTYGSWGWQGEGASGMSTHARNWANWFAQNSPATEAFLYLIDESSNYSQTQTWASELRSDGALKGMATLPLPQAINNTPSLDVVTSTMDVGDTGTWNRALAQLRSDSRKRFFMYNGKRPASGSFMIDDDGVALREVPWGQYKKGVDRWFYWESTYYTDFQSGRGDVDVFNNAQTFGAAPQYDSVLGMTSGNYANGDGVLFYPGTDRVFPGSSYGLNGPIASLRLKDWRRGIQDVDYLTLAAKVDPARTQAIVNSMVKSVLWENGISDPNDPTWVRCDLGWSTNPDDWENARKQLTEIIQGSD